MTRLLTTVLLVLTVASTVHAVDHTQEAGHARRCLVIRCMQRWYCPQDARHCTFATLALDVQQCDDSLATTGEDCSALLHTHDDGH